MILGYNEGIPSHKLRIVWAEQPGKFTGSGGSGSVDKFKIICRSWLVTFQFRKLQQCQPPPSESITRKQHKELQ